MSKGERNRRRRQQEEAAGRGEPLDPPDAMNEIHGIESADEFEALLSRRPGILSAETETWFAEMARMEGFEASVGPLATLIGAARSDPRGAWDQYRESMDRAEKAGEGLKDEMDLIDAAVMAGDHDDVIARVDVAMAKAHAAGLGVAAGLMHSQRATANVHRSRGDRAENIEAAITDYAAAVRLVVAEDQRAEVQMHAGVAFLERVYGDRAENIEQAISLLRDARAALTSASPPELHAIVETNLATALLRRERGGGQDSSAEAVELCRSALQYRSPERNARDWGYSQVNLGFALESLAAHGAVDIGEAIAAYEAVLAEADRVDDWLRGSAHHAIGRLMRRQAHHTAEEQVEAAVDGTELEVDREMLEGARTHLEEARPLVGDAPDYLLQGRVAMELSGVLLDLGSEGEETVQVAREALSILRPTAAPGDCAEAGYRLAGILMERGDWLGAADAYRDAVEAAELLFHARLETESRHGDIRRHGQLFRWAAFAIAAAGEPLEAALVLESGRTRELRRRLGLERREAERINELPRELAGRYRSAVEELAREPIGGSAGRELQETLESIRSIDGFQGFGGAASVADLSAAIEPGWPLVYVDPTPAGTLLLVVTREHEEVEATAFFLDPIAQAVYLRLMAGDVAADLSLLDTAEPSSYLALVAGFSDRPPSQDLEQVLPWLGEEIARHIGDAGAEAGASGVTLVACGPVSLAPIHAARWESENDGRRCLLDGFDVRYAQSALIAGAGIERASKRAGRRPALVGLADPTRDLDAAGPEVREIARHFPQGSQIASGSEATAQFLREHTAEATHLHLACHGRGGLLDTDTSPAIRLADGWLEAKRLTEVVALRSRLAVVSACQSAVSNLNELADESVSIGSVMMAAGTACAIVSLWPVHDLATALLMTRLYEEMVGEGLRPPEALRRAQHWLRRLDVGEEQDFLSRHPDLHAEFNRRADPDLPGDRQSAARAPLQPYANEYYWAGFVAVGA